MNELPTPGLHCLDQMAAEFWKTGMATRTILGRAMSMITMAVPIMLTVAVQMMMPMVVTMMMSLMIVNILVIMARMKMRIKCI